MQRQPEGKEISMAEPTVSSAATSAMKLVPSVNLRDMGPRINERSKSRAKWMPISDRKSERNSADDDFEPCASVASSFYLPTAEFPQSARRASHDSNDKL